LVTRTITVKEGTALFFPLINSEADNVCGRPNLGGNCFGSDRFPANLGEPRLQALAAGLADPATGLFATLTPTDENFNQTGTATNLAYARVPSNPFAFRLPISDNLYQAQGVNVSGKVAPGVADGFYSRIGAGQLTEGNYLLKFGGKIPLSSKPGNFFIQDITYQLTVNP